MRCEGKCEDEEQEEVRSCERVVNKIKYAATPHHIANKVDRILSMVFFVVIVRIISYDKDFHVTR
jgi:hypothetical protein